MPSRSLALTPACFSARSMVGTIASRWAREATSGTTPPNLACSSTLEATASASRVCPRTMPTPVSSQEVSIPRTNGSSGMAAILARRVEAHHDGVGPVPVVAPSPVDRLEPLRLVERERHLVRGADLEQHPRLPHGLEQPAGQSPSSVRRSHRDALEDDEVTGAHRHGVTDDDAVRDGHD